MSHIVSHDMSHDNYEIQSSMVTKEESMLHEASTELNPKLKLRTSNFLPSHMFNVATTATQAWWPPPLNRPWE